MSYPGPSSFYRAGKTLQAVIADYCYFKPGQEVNVATQTELFEMFEAAERRMQARFKLGQSQEQLLLEIVTKTVIVDRLVPPTAMAFLTGSVPKEREVFIHYKDGTKAAPGFTIHRHAFNQLCQKVGLPMTYATLLQSASGNEAWKVDLLCDNLNALFSMPEWAERGGQPVRFLHRLVGTELRGFLSHRYARHLATAPLLRAFIDSCRSAGAKPIEATSSSVRNALKCLLPKVFEAFPGEYICLGVEFSNSDFGAGRLVIQSTVWRVNTGAACVLDEALSKVHVGAIIDDSDLQLSEGTWQKETEAQKSVIVDVVAQLLSEKTVEHLLKALRFARDEQIPWSKLKARLTSIISKGDLDWLQQAADNGGGIVDLPPISFTPDGVRVPNAYWAAAAVGAIASKTEDQDRRMDLQREAGKLLAEAMRQA